MNQRRLQQWDSERALTQQCEAFDQHHEALKNTLQQMHDEATRRVASDSAGVEHEASAEIQGQPSAPGAELSTSAQK